MAQFHEQLLNRPNYSKIEPGTLSIGRPSKVRTSYNPLKQNEYLYFADEDQEGWSTGQFSDEEGYCKIGKKRKGRLAMALGGSSWRQFCSSAVSDTVASQDDPSDEDDNPGDAYMSGEEEQTCPSLVAKVGPTEEEECVQEIWDHDLMPPRETETYNFIGVIATH
jgi:hypothetical protein